MKLFFYFTGTFIITGIFFAFPFLASAATGDVLFQCDFSGMGSATEILSGCNMTTGAVTSRVTRPESGGHDGGAYLNTYFPNGSGTGDFEAYDPTDTPALNKREVTITWWSKYDVPENAATGSWNTKEIRPYVTGSYAVWNYFGALMSRWNAGRMYTGSWNETPAATLVGSSYTTNVATQSGWGNDYCVLTGTLTWQCPSSQGTNNGRFSYAPSPALGTLWHQYRLYLKAPSDVDGSSDGEEKLWIDDNLHYSITGISGEDGWTGTMGAVRFNPSAGFMESASQSQRVAFNHGYDDIIIYEGYVPSGGVDTIAPASPSGLSIN